MASGSRRQSGESQDSLPMYKTHNLGLSGDFVTVWPQMHDDIKQEPDFESARRSSNFAPPAYPPPGHFEEEKPGFWERHGHKIKVFFGLSVMVGVAAGLLIPVIKLKPGDDWTEEETPEESKKK